MFHFDMEITDETTNNDQQVKVIINKKFIWIVESKKDVKICFKQINFIQLKTTQMNGLFTNEIEINYSTNYKKENQKFLYSLSNLNVKLFQSIAQVFIEIENQEEQGDTINISYYVKEVLNKKRVCLNFPNKNIDLGEKTITSIINLNKTVKTIQLDSDKDDKLSFETFPIGNTSPVHPSQLITQTKNFPTKTFIILLVLVTAFVCLFILILEIFRK